MKHNTDDKCPQCGHELIKTYNRLDCPQRQYCEFPGVVLPNDIATMRTVKARVYQEEPRNAWFHGWDSEGAAIVEFEDGTCARISTSDVRFNDPRTIPVD